MRGLVLAVMFSAGAALAAPPADSPSAPDSDETKMPGLGEFLGMAVQAQLSAEGMQKRVQAMDDIALVQALAQLTQAAAPGTEAEMPAVDAPTLSKILGAPAPELLAAVYATPDAVELMDWLPAQQIKPAHEFFEDWQTSLKLKGRGADARLEVEPLEALFNKTIDAAPLGDYRVLEHGSFVSEITLFDLEGRGPKCCRVLVWPSFGDDPPVAFESLRQMLEHEWMAGELVRPYLTPSGDDD